MMPTPMHQIAAVALKYVITLTKVYGFLKSWVEIIAFCKLHQDSASYDACLANNPPKLKNHLFFLYAFLSAACRVFQGFWISHSLQQLSTSFSHKKVKNNEICGLARSAALEVKQCEKIQISGNWVDAVQYTVNN